jgi:polyhydroxyalkanoate synthesis repressor PhaR
MKLIKRYSNRKLYDTDRSCYVTLDEIAEMVRGGDEVTIVDNKTGEDLTTVTLAQIVYEAEKRDRRLLPLQSLQLIIQSPADFLARIGRPVAELREETQQRVERFRKRAEEQQEELVGNVREFVDSVQRSLDDIGHTIDERLKGSVDSLTHVPDLKEQMAALKEQLHGLESEVAALRETVRRAEVSVSEASDASGAQAADEAS